MSQSMPTSFQVLTDLFFSAMQGLEPALPALPQGSTYKMYLAEAEARYPDINPVVMETLFSTTLAKKHFQAILKDSSLEGFPCLRCPVANWLATSDGLTCICGGPTMRGQVMYVGKRPDLRELSSLMRIQDVEREIKEQSLVKEDKEMSMCSDYLAVCGVWPPQPIQRASVVEVQQRKELDRQLNQSEDEDVKRGR